MIVAGFILLSFKCLTDSYLNPSYLCVLSSASLIIEKVLLGEIHLLSSDSMTSLNMQTSNLLPKASLEEHLKLK